MRRNLNAVKAVAIGVAGTFVLAALAAEPAPVAGWQDISTPIIDQCQKDGLKIGFPGSGTAGVGVDPASGDVYVMVSDQGLWKSEDQGATFNRVATAKDGKAFRIGGRCETGWTFNSDPAGKRMAVFPVYGGGGVTEDGGKTWAPMSSGHFDYGAVDWEKSGRAFLAIRHESGGKLAFSTDAGTTWTNLGSGFALAGVFDDKTLLSSNAKMEPGLLRTTDAGKEWKKVSDEKITSAVMVVHKGVGYWLCEKGLLASKDKGATWGVQGAPVKANLGPYFGKDASQMVVVGSDGVYMTRDGGGTWTKAAPLAKDIKPGNLGWFGNYAWDAIHNVLYASSMGKPLYKLALGTAQ